LVLPRSSSQSTILNLGLRGYTTFCTVTIEIEFSENNRIPFHSFPLFLTDTYTIDDTVRIRSINGLRRRAYTLLFLAEYLSTVRVQVLSIFPAGPFLVCYLFRAFFNQDN